MPPASPSLRRTACVNFIATTSLLIFTRYLHVPAYLFMHTQNHDNNVNITHLLEIEREQLVAPLSYTRIAPPGVGGEGGPGNYWVPVCQHDRFFIS